jgi:hypothetical protein
MTTGTPQAPRTPSMMPRDRPNPKAPTAPSPGRGADKFAKGFGRVGLVDDGGKQRRIDRPAAFGAILQDGHVVGLQKIKVLVHLGDGAIHAGIDSKKARGFHCAISPNARRAIVSAISREMRHLRAMKAARCS